MFLMLKCRNVLIEMSPMNCSESLIAIAMGDSPIKTSMNVLSFNFDRLLARLFIYFEDYK